MHFELFVFQAMIYPLTSLSIPRILWISGLFLFSDLPTNLASRQTHPAMEL